MTRLSNFTLIMSATSCCGISCRAPVALSAPCVFREKLTQLHCPCNSARGLYPSLMEGYFLSSNVELHTHVPLLCMYVCIMRGNVSERERKKDKQQGMEGMNGWINRQTDSRDEPDIIFSSAVFLNHYSNTFSKPVYQS